MDNIPPKVEAQMNVLEQKLEPLFAKLPHLPQHIRDGIVNIVPWIALIVGILGILGLFSVLSMLPMFTAMPYMMAVPGVSQLYPLAIISSIINGIAAVLTLLAYKPLSIRKKKGWNFLFYANTLSAIASILFVVSGYGGIGGIVGMLVGYWLLFEIRGAYAA